VAKRVKPPANVKPKPVEPYTTQEIIKIIAACDQFGRTSYERLRARAMVLLIRYTALAISDVATLARDRVRDGEIRVFRRKTGNVVRLPVRRTWRWCSKLFRHRAAWRASLCTISGTLPR